MYRLLTALSFTILLCLPTFISAVPLSNLEVEDAQHVQVELIDQVSNLRHKRSASDSKLPDQLVFKVPLSGEDVVLRLKRADLLPVYTGQGRVNFMPNESGVYTDMTRESSMIVKRSTRGFSLSGMFNHANQAWNLQPFTRKGDSSSNHRLFPQRTIQGQTISFVGDQYYDTEKRPELISTVPRSRSKRETTQHTVEVAFVVDYADYTKWVNLVGSSNALSEMRLWFTYVSESINVRYASIQSSSIAIRTRTTYLRIITNAFDSSFISNIVLFGRFSGTAGLSAFRNWVISQGSAIPTSDHYMLFTGYDINGATGVAYTSEVCTSSSVSISEDTFQASLGGIAAHELGHCLGANHDSNEGCSDSDSFIMAAVLSSPVSSANTGNPWKFSPCSVSRFTSYLNGVSCTLPENTSQRDELPAPVSGQRAGQVLSRDEQCEYNFRDSSSTFCESIQRNNGGLERLCGGMFCSIPGRPGFCQTTLPQEFTTCGTDKWCVRGVCVDVSQETEPPVTQTPEPPVTQTPEPPVTQTPEPPVTQTPPNPNPTSISDCIVFLFQRDWVNLFRCLAEVIFGQNQISERERRQGEELMRTLLKRGMLKP